MDYENKENHFKLRGNLFLEISAILIFVILILFAGVVFHFYTEVNRLYDDKAELLARITAFEQRLSDIQKNNDVSRLAERQDTIRKQVFSVVRQIDTLTADESEQRLEQLQKRVAELEQKVATGGHANRDETFDPRDDTLRIRPGGNDLAAVEEADPNTRKKRKNFSRVRVRQLDESGKTKPKQPQTNYYGPGISGYGLKAALQECSHQDGSMVCDLKVSSVRSSSREIVFSNRASFAIGYDADNHRQSSFKIGTLGEKQRYKEAAPLYGSYPIDIQFQFYDIPEDVTGFKSIQFNIDDHAYIFENVRLN